MSGKIVDGWEFVWAAFVITWTALALYGGSLIVRERKSRRENGSRGADHG